MTTEAVEIFKFKINGVEIATDKPSLNAREILKIAKERHAISLEVDEYILLGQNREYTLVEEVDIVMDDLLISIPTGPTPVA